TINGDILVVQRDENGFLAMDFPHNPTQALEGSLVNPAIDIAKALLPDLNKVLEFKISPGTKKLLIRLDEDKISTEDIHEIRPNFEAMLSIDSQNQIRGVILTHRALEGSYDFVSRYFSPWNGIPEDPVNGSGHTALTPYWAAVLGKTTLFAGVLSKRRGELALKYDESKGRVTLSGRAVIVIKGQLFF
ncbi:Uncharacterized protein FKW44_013738, partial [Caligus rogercresseyi]